MSESKETRCWSEGSPAFSLLVNALSRTHVSFSIQASIRWPISLGLMILSAAYIFMSGIASHGTCPPQTSSGPRVFRILSDTCKLSSSLFQSIICLLLRLTLSTLVLVTYHSTQINTLLFLCCSLRLECPAPHSLSLLVSSRT